LLGLSNAEYGCGSVIVRHRRVDAGVVSIFADSALEAVAGKRYGLEREATNVPHTFGKQRRHRSEFAANSGNDRPSQFLLGLEQIARDLTIVAFRPKVLAGGVLDQLRHHTHTRAGLSDAAFEHRRSGAGCLRSDTKARR
jgi:hypothetical protein